MSDAPSTVAFFDNTLAEAMALTREARDYLSFQNHKDLAKLDAQGRLSASCEAMRVTARMTQVVAWLLVQKAVHAGELSREDVARPEYRLAGHQVCEADSPVADSPLPDRLVYLLDRSRQLYLRIARLDAMLDQLPA